ncbi:MAG TPA: hypothetical protein VFV97_08355 [Rhodanobacteraceae bacterium]|nr:hypothetical protein [Rhodanobacteraceae bacterium]
MPRVAIATILALAALPATAQDANETSPHALCDAHADALLSALGEGRYDAATTDFDAALRARYTPAKLKQDYEWLPSNYGSALGRGRAHSAEVNGRTTVMTPLIFANGTITVEVHCDGAGAVTDLKLLPTQSMGQPQS